MANMASWNGHVFGVDPKKIYAFKTLSIKASNETEDKTKSKQKYVSRKNGKPYEIILTIQLDARLGISDVKKESVKITEEARSGGKDYFYFGGSKIVNCKFMITEANIDSVEMLSNGVWISCDVKCTWKQCTKISGSSGSGGNGKGKGGKSSKNGKKAKNPKSKSVISLASLPDDEAIRKRNAVSSASDIGKLTRNASKASKKTHLRKGHKPSIKEA